MKLSNAFRVVSAWSLAVAAAEELEVCAAGSGCQDLEALRRKRNSKSTLSDSGSLASVAKELEDSMQSLYECGGSNEEISSTQPALSCPGNFHGIRSYDYSLRMLSQLHPGMSQKVLQAIIVSEWYHPALSSRAVWCEANCGAQFAVARLLDDNYQTVKEEFASFAQKPEARSLFNKVGSSTAQADNLLSGNGTWTDIKLFQGRSYNKKLCKRHFPKTCRLIKRLPEIWTNPWSYVLLSVLSPGSWVPFHHGATNAQLTYHLPLQVPSGGSAELAVIDRPGTLPLDTQQPEDQFFEHRDERVVQWSEGHTLVFDDSFAHTVRFRNDVLPPADLENSRVVLLLRGWHPELALAERDALQEAVRRGGREDGPGFGLLTLTPESLGLNTTSSA